MEREKNTKFGYTNHKQNYRIFDGIINTLILRLTSNWCIINNEISNLIIIFRNSPKLQA